MEYVVYCDESRHEGSGHHPFMAIGTLWIPRESKENLSREFKKLKAELDLNSEIKWSKVSNARLDNYKRLVDFFAQNPLLQFRVIVVDKAKLKDEKFHNGDNELGFYRFYYEVLEKWVDSENQFLILLDYKKNKGADRYADLRRCLSRKTNILDLTVIDSRITPLAQLCDLLTGATAASWCGLTEDSPKKQLADYLAKSIGKKSLRFPSTNPSRCKFNIFKIQLKP